MRAVISGYWEGAYSVHTVHSPLRGPSQQSDQVTIITPINRWENWGLEFHFHKCYRENNVSPLPPPKKDVYTLSPGIHASVSLRSKRGFADGIKWRSWDGFLWVGGGREDQIWRQCVIMEVEVSVMRPHERRNAGSSGSWGGGERSPLYVLLKARSPAGTWVSAEKGWLRTSDRWGSKQIKCVLF